MTLKDLKDKILSRVWLDYLYPPIIVFIITWIHVVTNTPSVSLKLS